MKILNSYDKVDSLYYSFIDVLRYIAFFSLVIISTILSITFYVSAVQSILNKIMLGFAAFSLESVKIYVLIYAEYVWFSAKNKSKKSTNFTKAIKAYILFSVLTLLSIVASISFAQASINSSIQQVQQVIQREESLSEKENPELIFKTQLLENKQAQLQSLNKKIESLPADYVTLSLKLSNEVNSLNQDIYDISGEIAQIKSDNYAQSKRALETLGNKKEAYSRFKLLGDSIGLSEQKTLFIFLTLFAVLIELGIISTAPAPDKRSIKDLLQDRLYQQKIEPQKIKKRKTPVKSKKAITAAPKQKSSSTVKKANITVDAIVPKIAVIKNQVKKRGTAAELLEELVISGEVYFKPAAQTAYTSKRTVDEYLHLLERLSKIKPGVNSKPLVSKDSKGYKMNYSLKYIKSMLKEKK